VVLRTALGGSLSRKRERRHLAHWVNVRIALLNAESAWSCNAMEQKGRALPVSPHGFSFPIKRFQIVAVRVKGNPAM
jgi:hypothetical protein